MQSNLSSESRTVRNLAALAFCLTVLILLILAGIGSRPAQAGNLRQSGWQEVVRVSATGARWKRVGYNAYDGHCGSAFCAYTPTTGEHAFWWTPEYTEPGTWGSGSSWWDNGWPHCGYHPVPAIGPHAYRAENHNTDYSVDLARQEFQIPVGYRVIAAELQVFSDNVGRYWINGVSTGAHGGHWGQYTFPDSQLSIFHSGTNLIAAASHNEEQMQGLQYLLRVNLVPQPGSLAVEHPWIVWYGPNVGQPAQVIRGHGFVPAEVVDVLVVAPPDTAGDPAICAGQTTYTVQADGSGEFVMSATSLGESYFGTQCKGGWQATGTGQSTGLSTNSVPWAVSWFFTRRER